MELKEIQDLIVEIKKNHEEFKHSNNEKLAALEKKGHNDPLIDEKLAKLNAAIDASETKRAKLEQELKARSDALEAALKRTAGESQMERKCELQDGTVVSESANEAARKSFQQFLRKGSRDILEGRQAWTPSDEEVKTMAVRSDPDGGFLVTADMSGRIVRRVFETSPMRSAANVVTIGTDALEGLYDLDELNCGWVTEAATRSQTGTPVIGKYRIQVHELYAMPAVSQNMLDDAQLDIEAYLADKISDKLARTENSAFVTGDGKGKPRGFLTYGAATNLGLNESSWTQSSKLIEQVTSATQGKFDFDSLIDIVYRLKAQYRNRAQWAFSRLAFPAIRSLKDNYGRYLWEPSVQVGMPSQLLGYGVIEMNDFPALAAGSLAAAFADWNESYQIVDRQGVRVLRDPFTAKPYVQFYTTKRTGGEVINGDAMKIYKLKA